MQKRKLKIVWSTWHIMHSWDLCNALKDYADFYFILNTWRSWEDNRFLSCRAIPSNVHFIPYFEKGKYDFAILDVDQQLSNPRLGKTKTYIALNEAINGLPKVVINHGSPVYPEYLQIGDMTKEDAKNECRRLIKDLIGDNFMIVNSYKAAEDWGWGYPIWHGMNKDDWYDLPKEPRLFSAMSPGGLNEYYNRYCAEEVVGILNNNNIPFYWARVNKKFTSPDEYKMFMGSSLVYLDTSIDTPMNRARTEAMLSGCAVVQVEGCHDQERLKGMIFVKNNPDEIAKKLMSLLDDYRNTVKIGQEGKDFALKTFTWERYKQDWLKFINDILKIKI